MQHTTCSTSTKSKLIFSIPSGYIQYIQQHYSHLFSCPHISHTCTHTRVESSYITICIENIKVAVSQLLHTLQNKYILKIFSHSTVHCLNADNIHSHHHSKKKRKRSYLPRPLFVLSSNPMLLTFAFLPFRLALYFAHSFALLSFALFSFSIDLCIMEKNKQTEIGCVKKKIIISPAFKDKGITAMKQRRKERKKEVVHHYHSASLRSFVNTFLFAPDDLKIFSPNFIRNSLLTHFF